MGKYTPETYKFKQQKVIDKLKANKRRGPITSAKFLAAMLRRNAPNSSGRTVTSVVRRKSQVKVGAMHNGFPYIHWINATPGSGLGKVRLIRRFRPSHLKRTTRALSFEEVARDLKTVNFVWKAVQKTRIHFKDTMLRNTKSAIIAET